MTDMHLHTAFSFDSDEDPENYIKAAIVHNDLSIGFSDHCEYNMLDYDRDFPLPDFDKFFVAVDKLSQRYGGIRMLKGVELGYSDSAVPLCKKLLNDRPFDYAIMSVHTVAGRGDCYFPAMYEGLDKREAYSLYLDEVYNSVVADVDFQIVGHIGYIARYAPYNDNSLSYSEFKDKIDLIIKQIISRDLCLELNTSVTGLNCDFVPERGIVNRYVELGGKNFSFGSDSHDASSYAFNREKVKSFLSSLGVNYSLSYENRKPIKEYF